MSIATAPLRNRGWSRNPTGSVSRNDETRDDLDPRAARRAARPRARASLPGRRGSIRARRRRDPQPNLKHPSPSGFGRARTTQGNALRHSSSRSAPSPPHSRPRLTGVRHGAAGARPRRAAPGARCAEAVFLTGAGGTPVAPSLALYAVPAPPRPRVVRAFAPGARCASARRTGRSVRSPSRTSPTRSCRPNGGGPPSASTRSPRPRRADPSRSSTRASTSRTPSSSGAPTRRR